MDCELGRISVAESTKEARAYQSTNRGTTNDRDEVRVMARPNVDRVDGGKMRGGRGEMMCEGEEDNLKVGQMEYARTVVAEAGTRG